MAKRGVFFLNNIRMERVRKGDSREKLATKIGCSQSSLYEWEHGIRPPSSSAIVKMSKYFGCSTDYLLGLSETRT